MMKLNVNNVRIDQLARYYRHGSVLAGTATSGSLGIDVTVDVDSPEPPDRIAELIRMARSSCYTHGALAGPVAVQTDVRLNGQSLEAGVTT